MARGGRHYRRERRRHSFLGGLIGLILLVLVVYAIVLGVSGYGIYQQHLKADAAIESCEAHLQNLEITAARADAEEAAGYLEEMNTEFKGIQWEIARKLPFIGTDTQIVIDTAEIAGDLVGKAFLPVLDGASGVTSGISGLDILGTLAAAPGAVGAVKGAIEVVRDCDERARELPESHFDFINDLTQELRNQTQQSASVLQSAESALGAADVVTDLLT